MGDTKQSDYKLLVDTAVMAGQLMLASGAEVYRVEDTVERILAVSGLKTRQAYVTSTGSSRWSAKSETTSLKKRRSFLFPFLMPTPTGN